MSNNEDNIKVSVCVVTYNQENYIAQCLQSIVDQKTDFKFEVIVGEDCSTDGTRAIVQQYADKYPDLIVPVFHRENIGASENVISVYNVARGKYIAHLDGDDYFLPNKIQLQKDFMDENPNVSISFHRTKISFPNGRVINDNYDLKNNPKFYSIEELVLLGAIGTNSSKMFMRSNHSLFIDRYHEVSIPVLDYLYNVMIIGNGKVGYLQSDPLSVYRRGIGVSSMRKDVIDYHKKSLDIISEMYNGEYDSHIGALSLLVFFTDLKNKRKTKKSLEYVKNYTDIKSVFILKKYLKILKSLNWPKI